MFAFFELAINYGTGFPKLDTFIFEIKNRVVDNVIFKFLADTSYGVYLIHIPLLTVLLWFLTNFEYFVSLSPVMRFFSAAFIFIPIVYLIAYLAFKYIETPGISMGRKLIRRIT